jgi:opacity protein-like surface antigen
MAGWADLSAMTSNPSGLGYYNTSEVTGGLNLLVADDASTFQAAPDNPTFSQEGETSSLNLGSLAGVYNVPTEQGSLVFGVGYTRSQTFDRTLSYGGRNDSSSITDTFLPTNTEYEVDSLGVLFPDDVPSNIIPFIAYQSGAIEFREDWFKDPDIAYPFDQAVLAGTSIQQNGTVQREGQMNEVNFAGAIEASKNLMLGASANITTGEYRFEHELTEIDQGENENYEVIRNGRVYRGLDQMRFRERFESTFTGFNLRVGLSTTVISNVRLGLTAETPTWTSVTENFTDAIIRTDFRDGQSLAYGDDPEEDVGRGTFDYQITTPWRLGAGLALKSDHFRANASVEFVDWSNLKLDSNSFDFPGANDRIDRSFGYVFNWRGGVEYTSESGLALRGGMAYRPDPRQYDFTAANEESYERSRTFYSLGVSYPLSDQITMDVGLMQTRRRDQFAPYELTEEGTPSFLNPDEISTPLVDEEVTRHQIQIDLRYRF